MALFYITLLSVERNDVTNLFPTENQKRKAMYRTDIASPFNVVESADDDGLCPPKISHLSGSNNIISYLLIYGGVTVLSGKACGRGRYHGVSFVFLSGSRKTGFPHARDKFAFLS